MDPAFYDRYADLQDRHWWFTGRRRIIREEVARSLARLAPAPGATPQLLDVGCGTGVMLGELGRLGRVRGVDADASAVAHCHRRGFPDVAVAGTPPLAFADGAFDLVTALDVLEHVEDDAGMVAEIRRLLRPGGRLVASVPALPALWGTQDEISHHHRRYVRRTLEHAVTAGGLEIERLTAFNTLLFAPIAAVRLARRLRPAAGDPASDFEMTREGPVNTALGRLFAGEARWLRRRDLPFGVSLLVVAVRR